MTNARIVTDTINELRQHGVNDYEVAIDFLGTAVPILIEVSGAVYTAKFLRDMANQVEQHEGEI